MNKLLYIVFIISALCGTTGSTQLTYRALTSTVVVPYQYSTQYPIITTCSDVYRGSITHTTTINTIYDYTRLLHSTQLISSLICIDYYSTIHKL